jgi:hypothetical protein
MFHITIFIESWFLISFYHENYQIAFLFFVDFAKFKGHIRILSLELRICIDKKLIRFLITGKDRDFVLDRERDFNPDSAADGIFGLYLKGIVSRETCINWDHWCLV